MELRPERTSQTASGMHVRPEPETRRRLSGPALRTFFNIAAAWELTVHEQRALLGWPATSTFHKYKAGNFGTLSFDTLTRISLLIGIYKSLQILYPEPGFADRWVRMPNSHQLFGGRPALALMTDGGIDGLHPGAAAARRPQGRMELSAPEALVRWKSAPRLVPSRYPVAGLLDRVADPGDLDALFELEGWTNDRISAEVGLLHTIPRDEWVTGRPMASVVMAAFCHPRREAAGSRPATAARGTRRARSRRRSPSPCITARRSCARSARSKRACRCACTWLISARASTTSGVRGVRRRRCTIRNRYAVSQEFGRQVLESGGNGIVYRSVRDPRGSASSVFGRRLSATCAPAATTNSNGPAGPSLRCGGSD